MSYFTVGYRLPRTVSAPLFGDRKRFGLKVQPDDPCWIEWQGRYLDFYYANQKQSIGKTINDAGYEVMARFDMTGKKVLEIGPGDIHHIGNWKGKPAEYVIADIQQDMLDRSSAALHNAGIQHATRLLAEDELANLPFKDEAFDAIVSFYAFEHLHPFADYLEDMLRVLKGKGVIIGAIPCEGGLAWGMGRALTSRQWLKKNTTINPDKIICWEHPNFADSMLTALDSQMHQRHIDFWPFRVPAVDLNFVIRFVYEKR